MSYTDRQKLKYARGHLFCRQTAKNPETYQVYQNSGPMVHELTLFVYSLKRCEVCIEFGFGRNANWVERTSVTGKIAEATAAAGVRFSLRTLISFITFRVAGCPIEAL